MEDRTRKMMDELIERSGNAYVCSVDEAGYPLVKCMFARGKSGNQFYFSSNLSSRRTGQFLHNSKSSVYFCDEANFQAVLLSGEMEVLTDLDHRRMIWREGDEQYYPTGVEDADYCVLRLTARRGRCYLFHAQENRVVMEDFEL